MSEVVVRFDPHVDAAYISLTAPGYGTSSKMYACDPIEVGGMINLDFDQDGRLIGIEVLGASSKLPHSLLDGAERQPEPKPMPDDPTNG